MDYLYYQNKLNDVISKCPIEAGIEILVYNLLDESIRTKKYSLVDINRIRKGRDGRLSTEAGISDIAILSSDFRYQTDVGKVYGFVEVKAAGVSLGDSPQILGQMKDTPNFIYTNGIVWRYYKDQQLQWEKNLGISKTPHSVLEIEVDKNAFEELIDKLRSIQWGC